jgi:iron complex transport system substrate-binding protein
MHPLRRRATTAVMFVAAWVAIALPAAARQIVDSAGRTVTIPDQITRVFAAGPPSSVLLYVLKPEAMTGWVRSPRAGDKKYLLPSVRDLPELGRLTGRGDTINPEVLVANKPDLIVDYGTVTETYRSLAERVQAQTGIPYVLMDGKFANTPAALRLLGDILGVKDRGETLARYTDGIFGRVDAVLKKVPATARPHVYLARRPTGLETGTRGSINTEIIERAGGVNVVDGLTDRGGLVDVSPEQILAWAPDTIVTLDKTFAAGAATKPEWASVPAVKAKRILTAPDAPFGFIDFPPSINRLAGLVWLVHAFYPTESAGDAVHDLKGDLRAFYKLFYQSDLSDADLDALLAGG